MATTSVVSASDGPRTTVSDLVANPLWIPTALKEDMTDIFLSEALFRNGGANPSGVVAYSEGDPSFLDSDVQQVAEFGEIPVSAGRKGTPKTAFAVKKALGVRISLEMVRENNVREVDRQLKALSKTFRLANDLSAKALLTSAAVPTLAVSAAWDTTNGKPRKDLAKAIEQISIAAPAVADGGSAYEFYGFEPDTIVMHPGLRATLLDNDNILKVYQGNLADRSIAYTGALPEQLFGLNVVVSRTFPIDKVLVLERGTVGFYSDTWPLEFTPLYAEGNGPNGGPTQSWRSDASHKRAIALDQPKAALWLTGVVTP